MNRATWTLLALIGILAGASAQVIVGGPKKVPATFQEGIAARVKLKVEAVDKLLETFGPAVTEQLLAGRTVELPGIAVVRVVRVAERRDLVGGVPTTVPARNYVEIVPSATLDAIANQPGVVPARVVEPYEFRVNPDATPGIKTDSIKTPRTRIGR